MSQFQVWHLRFSPKFLFISKKYIINCGGSMITDRICYVSLAKIFVATQLFSMLAFMMRLFLQAEATFCFGKLRMWMEFPFFFCSVKCPAFSPFVISHAVSFVLTWAVWKQREDGLFVCPRCIAPLGWGRERLWIPASVFLRISSSVADKQVL